MIEIRQRFVIEQNLIRADLYVSSLVEDLMQFDISEDYDSDNDIAEDNPHIQFLKQLTMPIVRPPLIYLEQMQKSELGTYNHFETMLN